MGKSSQRKGRGGEHEVAMDLRAGGFDAAVNGIYEKLDVRCCFGTEDWQGEVKRKAKCAKDKYDAFDNGAKFFVERADRKPWLITFLLKDFMSLKAPKKDPE
jgi:hypothetical protein